MLRSGFDDWRLQNETALIVIASMLVFAPLTPLTATAQPRDAARTLNKFLETPDSVRVSYAGGWLQISNLYAVCLPTSRQPASRTILMTRSRRRFLPTVIKNSEGKSLKFWLVRGKHRWLWR